MRVLIVEDQPMLAFDLEHNVVGEGHEVIGIAGSMLEALALAESETPDLAFVDVQLNDGATGVAIAGKLVSENLKVVFTTGSPELLPSDGCGATGVLVKPYTATAVRQTLAYIAHLLNLQGQMIAPQQLRTFAQA